MPVTRPPSFGVAMDLRCEHCTTYRRDILNPRSGEVLQRVYTYPDGYKDAEQHSRSDWRSMFVSTLSEDLALRAETTTPKLRAIRGGRARRAAS